MKSAYILFILTLMLNCAFAQKNVELFDFIYIDNSKAISGDGLSEAMYTDIYTRLESINNNGVNDFLLFISDRNQSTSTSTDQYLELLRNLRDVNTSYPLDKVREKERIRKSLMAEPFSVFGKINFHFYVSDYYCLEISEKPAILVKWLPKEFLSLMNKNDLQVEVNLYYSNDTQRINEEKLLKTILYNETNRNKNISYKLKKLS